MKTFFAIVALCVVGSLAVSQSQKKPDSNPGNLKVVPAPQPQPTPPPKGQPQQQPRKDDFKHKVLDDTRRLESLRADVRRIDSELQDLERRYSSSSNRRSHGEQYDRKLAEFKKAVNALDNYLDSVR